MTQKTKEYSTDQEEIDGIKIRRLNCGDLVDRIREFSLLSPSEKDAKASEYFNRNDIEETAFKLAAELEIFIKEYNPDVIHFHNSFFISPYALYFLKNKYDRLPKFFFWVHSTSREITLPSGEVTTLYNTLASFQNVFNEVIAVSKSVYNDLQRAGIKAKVRYLGVDVNVFTKQTERRNIIREKLALSEHAFVVLYTGRLIKEKGLDLLPHIAKHLYQRGGSYVTINYLIVGEGDYKELLVEQLKELGVHPKFHFVVAKSDEELIDYYSCADCFILPTRREALGLSLLEAMSCSLPSIVTNLPCTNEIVNHAKNGLLVSADNIQEFARWISGLFSNKKIREEISLEARNTVEQNFNFDYHYKIFRMKLS